MRDNEMPKISKKLIVASNELSSTLKELIDLASDNQCANFNDNK